MLLEVYIKNEPIAIRMALKLMATISMTPRQAMPEPGGLEDSLSGDGDGNTGKVEDSLGNEGDDDNNINEINGIEKHYISVVETSRYIWWLASEPDIIVVWFRELAAHSALIGASTPSVTGNKQDSPAHSR